ncbi:MAG TPA: NAD(P)/FAD-dependent oxidoreductase [Streptosporangiaceae bacterium]|nr:NAD(P)/FAD-dependent oxidoreductase [Streptosporangiaceae bacterium]
MRTRQRGPGSVHSPAARRAAASSQAQRSAAQQAGPRVVVIGGGFAGLSALHALRGRGAAVTLVDRNVYSTFQPLLYQVATAGLTSSDVAYPLWSVTRKTGARFHRGLLEHIDTGGRVVRLDDGSELGYDYLILATGVSANFFGIPGADNQSMSLYTRRDAVALRERLESELEQRSWGGVTAGLSITIAGGGATGVELAGTLAELRNIAVPASFPGIDPATIKVTLIEQAPALLAAFKPREREYARRELQQRGVDVLLGTAIKELAPGEVLLANGTSVPSDITVWAAGVAAPEAIGQLGLAHGHSGRLLVGPDLRVQGEDRIFAAGDISVSASDPVAQLAQPAIQQGRHAAQQILRLIAGQDTAVFHYHDKGIMATIGSRSAVVELPVGVRLRGTLAWLAWLGLHLYTLLGNRQRINTLVNLSWRYLTWSRGGGIIVGDDPTEAD